MVEYKCYRCGYIASQKINLKHHLHRKNICNPILEDISIEKMYEMYNFKNNAKQHPGNRRRRPHLLVVEGILVDVVHNRQGRLQRFTTTDARHDERLGEELEGTNHLDNQQEEGRRADQRNGNATEAIPGIGAIHTRCFVEFLRDALQTR